MRLHRLILLLSLLGLLIGCHGPADARRDSFDALTDPERRMARAAIDQAEKALVRIGTRDGYGTGVIVHPAGLVLTAAHHRMWAGRVTDRRGKDLRGVPLIWNECNDWAIIRLDAPGPFPYLPIAEQTRYDEALLLGGWGADRGAHWAAGRLLMRRFSWPSRTGGYNYRSFAVTGPAFPGDSGGPVINLRGELVGILVEGSGHKGGEASFGLRADRFAPFIETLAAHTRASLGPLLAEARRRGEPELLVRMGELMHDQQPGDLEQEVDWILEGLDILAADQGIKAPVRARLFARMRREALDHARREGLSGWKLLRWLLPHTLRAIRDS